MPAFVNRFCARSTDFPGLIDRLAAAEDPAAEDQHRRRTGGNLSIASPQGGAPDGGEKRQGANFRMISGQAGVAPVEAAVAQTFRALLS